MRGGGLGAEHDSSAYLTDIDAVEQVAIVDEKARATEPV